MKTIESLRSTPFFSSWAQQIAAAIKALEGKPIIFKTHHTAEDLTCHNGKAIVAVIDARVAPCDDLDEIALPYMRVRLDDGQEIDAELEEMHGAPAEMERLTQIVSAPFGASRQLGYEGPWHLFQDDWAEDLVAFDAAIKGGGVELPAAAPALGNGDDQHPATLASRPHNSGLSM